MIAGFPTFQLLFSVSCCSVAVFHVLMSFVHLFVEQHCVGVKIYRAGISRKYRLEM